MLDLTLPDQLLHRAGNVFDRHVRIDAVLIEEIDDLGLEPLERGFGDLPDMLRPAIGATLPALQIEFEAELCCDHDLLADGRKSFAQKLFVLVRAIGLGSVKERDATLEGRPDQCDRLLLVGSGAVAIAQSHAAEADGRDLQATAPQRALSHVFLP